MNGRGKVRVDILVGNGGQDPVQYDLIKDSSSLSITPIGTRFITSITVCRLTLLTDTTDF